MFTFIKVPSTPYIIINMQFNKMKISGLAVECEAQTEIVERNKFLKKACSAEHEYYKCLHSEESYTIWTVAETGTYKSRLDKVCQDDQYFYQLCGLTQTETLAKNNEALCGKYMCDSLFGYITDTMVTLFGLECNGVSDCTNTDLDEAVCGDEGTVTMMTGAKIGVSNICDNECHDYYCEDEANCNGYSIW